MNGAKLREIREKLGLTRREAAQRSGTTEQTLYSIESGMRDTHIKTASALAKAYGMTLPELLEATSED